MLNDVLEHLERLRWFLCTWHSKKDTTKTRWCLLILQDQISLNPSAAAKTSSQLPKIKQTHTHIVQATKTKIQTSKPRGLLWLCYHVSFWSWSKTSKFFEFFLSKTHPALDQVWSFQQPWSKLIRNLGLINGWMVGLMVGLLCLKELVGFLCFFSQTSGTQQKTTSVWEVKSLIGEIYYDTL